MNKSKRVTLQNWILRKKFLKNEFKNKIIKSIIQNQNTKLLLKGFLIQKLTFLNNKKTFLSRQQNSCPISGKPKTTNKYTSLSRHKSKHFIHFGMLNGVKSKN